MTVPAYTYRIGQFHGGYWIDSTAPIGTFASTVTSSYRKAA